MLITVKVQVNSIEPLNKFDTLLMVPKDIAAAH